MSRVPDTRPPASPSSEGQKDRYRRMLAAAVDLGTRQEFERVQMQDVAVVADVAIATLYRYFPSKVHLYVAVMKAQLATVDAKAFSSRPAAPSDPTQAVGDLLIMLTRRLHENRRLSMSMMQSIILAGGMEDAGARDVEDGFLAVLLKLTGWGNRATEDQRRRVWLVIQCWFGVLMTTVGGGRPLADAEADIRRACELLLTTSDHAG
ncbi:MAG: kstR 1 [Marmoricola sp.]|nr:kstR 1 [Marmoricola sp.]